MASLAKLNQIRNWCKHHHALVGIVCYIIFIIVLDPILSNNEGIKTYKEIVGETFFNILFMCLKYILGPLAFAVTIFLLYHLFKICFRMYFWAFNKFRDITIIYSLRGTKIIEVDTIRQLWVLFLENYCIEQKDTSKNIISSGPKFALFAIDLSKPSDWWSNGMIAYDNVLSLWSNQRRLDSLTQYLTGSTESPDKIDISVTKLFRLHVQKRQGALVRLAGEIERIFIWRERELKHPFGANLLAAQYLRGYNIYLIAKELFDQEQLDPKVVLKEFLIWDIYNFNEKPEPARFPDIGMFGEICFGYKAGGKPHEVKPVPIKLASEWKSLKMKWRRLKYVAIDATELSEKAKDENVTLADKISSVQYKMHIKDKLKDKKIKDILSGVYDDEIEIDDKIKMEY